MPPRRKLNDFERAQATAWLQDQIGVREVARRLGVSHPVIIRLHRRFQATGRVQDRPRSGRPRKTTAREDRFIQRQARQERRATANVIRHRLRAVTHTRISEQTTRNRLHDVNLHARRPIRRPRLTENHRHIREAWSREHQRWTRDQWSNVMFSDESRFCLRPNDGRVRVWRRPGEHLLDDAVQEYVPFGGGSVMVWGGISTYHRTPLYHVDGNLNGERYLQEILQPLVVPALQQIGPEAVFQDDNARPHRGRAVNAFVLEQGIRRLDWPACSPDLNPIEHVWAELGRRIKANHPPAANRQELLGQLQQEWNDIPQAFLARLVNSMRRRCIECLAAQGGHTHY